MNQLPITEETAAGLGGWDLAPTAAKHYMSVIWKYGNEYASLKPQNQLMQP